MKYLVTGLALFSLMACSDPSTQDQTKQNSHKQEFVDRITFSERCLNGFVYLMSDNSIRRGYMAPKFNGDGTVATCKGK